MDVRLESYFGSGSFWNFIWSTSLQMDDATGRSVRYWQQVGDGIYASKIAKKENALKI